MFLHDIENLLRHVEELLRHVEELLRHVEDMLRHVEDVLRRRSTASTFRFYLPSSGRRPSKGKVVHPKGFYYCLILLTDSIIFAPRFPI